MLAADHNPHVNHKHEEEWNHHPRDHIRFVLHFLVISRFADFNAFNRHTADLIEQFRVDILRPAALVDNHPAYHIFRRKENIRIRRLGLIGEQPHLAAAGKNALIHQDIAVNRVRAQLGLAGLFGLSAAVNGSIHNLPRGIGSIIIVKLLFDRFSHLSG